MPQGRKSNSPDQIMNQATAYSATWVTHEHKYMHVLIHRFAILKAISCITYSNNVSNEVRMTLCIKESTLKHDNVIIKILLSFKQGIS